MSPDYSRAAGCLHACWGVGGGASVIMVHAFCILVLTAQQEHFLTLWCLCGSATDNYCLHFQAGTTGQGQRSSQAVMRGPTASMVL